MTLMLIGIVPAGTPSPAGLPDHCTIPSGPWTGLALSLPEEIDLAGEEGTIRFARARHEILCCYAASADVLPVAAGGGFANADAVARRIADDAERIASLHARLAGYVEYALAIDVGPDVTPAVAAGSGRDHLRQRARMRDQRGARGEGRRSFVERLGRDIGGRAAASRTVAGRSAPRLARIDMLLRREDIAPCAAALSERLPEAGTLSLNLSLTGPYPPFSFLDGAWDD